MITRVIVVFVAIIFLSLLGHAQTGGTVDVEVALCLQGPAKSARVIATFYRGTELRYEKLGVKGVWRFVSTIARNYKCWIRSDQLVPTDKNFDLDDPTPDSRGLSKAKSASRVRGDLTVREITDAVFPSTVLITTFDQSNRPLGLGSGFFVDKDIIATNYHVLAGAYSGTAKIVGKSQAYFIEGAVALDGEHDVALLKLRGANEKPLHINDSDTLTAGEAVYAIGNPRGLEGTITPGIISSIELRTIGKNRLIQITTPISPGSSGGPLVNRRGEVIGMTTSSLSGGQNLNFAVPSLVIRSLRSNRQESATPLRAISGQSADSGASFEETSTWLSQTVEGTENVFEAAGETVYQRIDIFSFADCRFTVRLRAEVLMRPAYTTLIETPVLNIDRVAILLSGATHLAFLFEEDVTAKYYLDGRLYNTQTLPNKGYKVRVKDQETGDRIVKAIQRIRQLCYQRKRSSPF